MFAEAIVKQYGIHHPMGMIGFRFVDWLMALPPELEHQFLTQLEAFEEEQKMPYVTSAERIGIEKGRQEGRQEGIQEGLREGLIEGITLALRLKFGENSQELLPEIRRLTDLAVIRAVYARIMEAQSLDDVRRAYR